MVLCPVIGKLQHKHVVLASASPRRQEILSNAGLRFEVVPSRFKEKLHKASFATPYAYAVETAKQKALEVAGRMHQKDLRAPDVVIGADTIVAVGATILEKPVDKQDAYRMLSRLNGKEHSVFTGVAIVHCCSKDGRLDTEVSEFYEETTVTFSELSEELLWEYINSGEPMDKAGGYGIQALGGMLVENVHGDFLNVVGFPLNHFCKELARLYYPPRPEGLRRVKHDSIPAVDTFENLSDTEGGGSDPGPSAEGGRGGEEADGDRSQAPGALDAALNGAESRPPFPTGLLELMDGFKASKVLFTACKLKLFDVLKDQGPLKAVDVARKLDACAGGTEQLLDVCVALGLLEKTHRGCTGILARELAREYPHLQVTVFDLPEVIELSGGFQRGGRQTERIRFVPGDFFKDNLPEADLYVLSRILQDWPDDRLHKLLSRISSGCKPALRKTTPVPDLLFRTKARARAESMRAVLQEVTVWPPPSWGPVSCSRDLFPGPVRPSTTAAPPLGSEPCKLRRAPPSGVPKRPFLFFFFFYLNLCILFLEYSCFTMLY
ncbi:probable bifunctional dTTP/UTP pyrophosphatase/methyltransferase protein isoform X3 [Balaenoptera acutorostrata]|uniref:Probable bifunctional dTTP/UTP pyrophosphatase/methyltransferase protein isoform X3 n=1 Tax=Balaenoptera acutorostrata TaxID=9767 RepID=A0ABM3SXX3_BALAC|nr:probable bifunctional dTTP/UTP pyrophosphatase/methyltransferase protein isoform X3 [Balaenoptera acutorostrata]